MISIKDLSVGQVVWVWVGDKPEAFNIEEMLDYRVVASDEEGNKRHLRVVITLSNRFWVDAFVTKEECTQDHIKKFGGGDESTRW